MVVQHNLTAMNSNRMLGLTSKAQAKSTERLSSGYKINRAADDAAGLAISEKMRKQIRGLTQASANAQDGISAVQTAEGALTEVHDMLQRMNELAVKAANGTNSESDRQSIQDEVDQLITEIDRVSETTKFNETYLLKGEGKNAKTGEVSALVDGKTVDGTVIAAKGNIFEATFDMSDATKLASGTEDKATITYLDENGDKRTRDVTFVTGKDAKATAANLADAINGDDVLKQVFKASSDTDGKISIESKLDGNQTDDTKNKVEQIIFESQTQAADPSKGAVTRVNKFVGDTVAKDTDLSKIGLGKQTAATREGYSVAIGGVTGKSTAGTAPTLALKLATGESVTINGKTYTYDPDKDSSDANSFKTLEDLQNLIGNEYDVTFQVSATKVSTAYSKNTATGKDGDNDPPVKGATTESEFAATFKGAATTEIADLAAQMADTSWSDDMAGSAAPTKNSEVATKPAEVYYKDIKLELVVTQKAAVEKESDVLNFSLQVGADTTAENKISVDIQSMSAKSLGINKVSVTGKDSTNADKAVNTIADAIAQVSKQRSALGAVQNRLEHTINNLDNVVENTTSAESAIRDTDMATEMVRYSNNNILAQAGQSMLAQANQSNQGVLSLLG